MRDTFVAKLLELAELDPRIFLITADLGFGVLTKFSDRFPAQFLNAGVAEQNMTGLATGLSMLGRTVFTYSIANFPILRCLEQVRNDACYHNANVKIVSIGGGFSYGSLGISHHATEDLSIMRALPEITVVAPCDRWETSEATEAAARTPGTFYLRLDKSLAPDTQRPGERFAIGKARTVRDGNALTLVATGGIVGEALRAADDLARADIECRVISCHTLKPLDREFIRVAVRETGGIVTIEENSIDGGLGGAVAEVCMDEGLRPRLFARIALRAGFSSIVGSQQYLRERYGMNAGAIVETALRLLGKVPAPAVRTVD